MCIVPTIAEKLIEIENRLSAKGIENARFEARLLMTFVFDFDRMTLVAYPERALPVDGCLKLEEMVRRRENREPMSHIIGNRDFWDFTFKVNAATLTPRSDSETLIEAVLEIFEDREQPLNILDLGVGSGCLLLTLLSLYEKANGLGIDQSKDALCVAQENADALSLLNRTRFLCNDWANGLSETFDVIISNPPYIPLKDKHTLEPEVADFEPHSALFAGDDGLDDYRKLAAQFPMILKNDGFAFLELGINQAQAVAEIMSCYDLEVYGVRKDIQNIERCMIIRKNFKKSLENF